MLGKELDNSKETHVLLVYYHLTISVTILHYKTEINNIACYVTNMCTCTCMCLTYVHVHGYNMYLDVRGELHDRPQKISNRLSRGWTSSVLFHNYFASICLPHVHVHVYTCTCTVRAEYTCTCTYTCTLTPWMTFFAGSDIPLG